MQAETGHLTEMEFDLAALRANYREIARRAGPGIKLMPSIKADAYGYGARETAPVFEELGAYALFTGNVEEAIAIRRSGVRTPLILFATYLPTEIPLILAEGLIPTVHTMDLARAVSAQASGPTEIWIKVDAGLGRIGIPIGEAAAFISTVARLPNIVISGVYTHLAFGTVEGKAWAQRRLGQFDDLIAALRASGIAIPVTQAIASACFAAGLEDKSNAICVGHLVYGLSPFRDEVADLSSFRPVLRRIRSKLIHVARHEQGADLAIGGLYGLRRGKTTGVLPVGLSHGLGILRAPGEDHAVISGAPAPLLGISLEHTTLDLDAVGGAALGAEALLVDETPGSALTLQRFAQAQNRTPLELMVHLAGRWKRVYA